METTHEEEPVVMRGSECPACGENRVDELVWDRNGEVVSCQTCGAHYQP